jgi:hypothetical protein
MMSDLGPEEIARLIESITPLLIMLAGMSLALGLFRLRSVVYFIVLVLLAYVFWPLFYEYLDQVPQWAYLVFGTLIGIAVLQRLVAVFLGRRAADAMAGHLAASFVVFILTVLTFPLRIARRIIQAGS